MARVREVRTISFDPANPDAMAVLDALKEQPKGAASTAILRWAAAYLRGEAATIATEPPQDDDSALDDALDNL